MSNEDEIPITEPKDECHDAAVPDQFEDARGKADIKWRTDELMLLLRGED